MVDTQILESSTQVFTKDPNAVLDYVIDWSGDTDDGGPWLATGETITSTTWTVATGITKDSDTKTTTTATAWLSSGTAGTDYIVSCKISTSANRTDERSLLIKVRDR